MDVWGLEFRQGFPSRVATRVPALGLGCMGHVHVWKTRGPFWCIRVWRVLPLAGRGGGGVAVLWPLIFFAQLTVHCKAAAIKRQEHELSLAPQPAAVAEARVLQ